MTKTAKPPKYEALSSGQLDQIRKMAKDKGITRKDFQTYGLVSGLVAEMLDGIKAKRPMVLGELVAPPGARLHIVQVPVTLDQDWQEAINVAGPDTPANYNVRKVGDQYPTEGTGTREDELILLNFPQGDGNWDKAQAWAKQYQLERTHPRQVFAIGARCPKLHQELGMNPMYVVATKECTFEGHRQACYVWWRASDRKAGLHWVGSFSARRDWFAFRRQSSVASGH